MIEPTLSLDFAVMARRDDFTSPIAVRLHLWWLGLTGRARAIQYRDARISAKGWEIDGATYVTRVRVSYP